MQDVAIVAVPAGIVGGRLYFPATSWNEGPQDRCGTHAQRLRRLRDFQPTFLYEIVWNLVLAAFLVVLG